MSRTKGAKNKPKINQEVSDYLYNDFERILTAFLKVYLLKEISRLEAKNDQNGRRKE